MRTILIFLFATVSLTAQNPITPGVVIPAVQFDLSDSQTFALYLPRDYDENKLYPTVFIFEAEGNGAAAVQKFTIASELTNTIIVAANKAVNDSLKSALRESEVFINGIYERFSVDQERIILAGNGVGALVACASAHLSQNVIGVIAINDAYIDLSLLLKKRQTKFAILASDEGGQFYKLNGLAKILKGKDILAGFYPYEGDATIPEAGFLASALSAVLIGKVTDTELIASFYAKDLEFGDLLLKRQKHLSAFEFVDGLKKKYKRKLDDLDGQKELLKRIRTNRTFKRKRSQRNAVLEGEELLADDFQYYLTEDVKHSYFDNLGWWSYQMDDLDAKIDSTAAHPQERKAAIRLKNYVIASTEGRYKELLSEQASLEQLLFTNVLRTLVDPTNTDAFIQAISLSSKEGDVDAALFYLEELLKSGYTDYEALYAIDGTTALRIGQEFNEIVKAYLGKSKYY